MRKFHIALSVDDIEQSVADYTKRLGEEPVLVVPNAYALWRTAQLNLSIRKTTPDEAGKLRHLGWESDDAACFSSDSDCNGIVWEAFSSKHQAQEIRETWPASKYEPGS